MSKLGNILRGWKNYIWEAPEIEELAKKRAEVCAGCNRAVHGTYAEWIPEKRGLVDVQGLVCELCTCPLVTLLRSPNAECKKNKWK